MGLWSTVGSVPSEESPVAVEDAALKGPGFLFQPQARAHTEVHLYSKARIFQCPDLFLLLFSGL